LNRRYPIPYRPLPNLHQNKERAGAPDPQPCPVHPALALGGFAIGTTEFATMNLVPFFAPGLGICELTAGYVISAYALGVVVDDNRRIRNRT
jgi:hypothetical protein